MTITAHFCVMITDPSPEEELAALKAKEAVKLAKRAAYMRQWRARPKPDKAGDAVVEPAHRPAHDLSTQPTRKPKGKVGMTMAEKVAAQDAARAKGYALISKAKKEKPE